MTSPLYSVEDVTFFTSQNLLLEISWEGDPLFPSHFGWFSETSPEVLLVSIPVPKVVFTLENPTTRDSPFRRRRKTTTLMIPGILSHYYREVQTSYIINICDQRRIIDLNFCNSPILHFSLTPYSIHLFFSPGGDLG